jgi:protein subunit release factor B
MIVTQEKINQLHKRMKALHIQDNDLIEKFILGSGTGGQKINKTSSCVYLKHIPSGIQIKCQVTRSREYNRYLALSAICDRLEQKAALEIQEKIHLKEKIRRQNKKRSYSGQMKVMEEKKHRAKKKQLRGRGKDEG